MMALHPPRGNRVVLPWNMVDKYHNPLQTDFGAVFGEETVQTGLLSPEGGSIRVLLLSHAPISPQHDPAPPSGFDALKRNPLEMGTRAPRAPSIDDGFCRLP